MNNKVFEIHESDVQAAFKAAKSQEVKDVLAALFAKPESQEKPNLENYKSIKSYEGACEALGIEPLSFDQSMPKHIAALMKLETISRALWGKDWEPKPDGAGSQTLWDPWFALYTENEIEDYKRNHEDGALLSGDAHDGALAGFGFLITCSRSSLAPARLGFRLCQETEEKARYFGTTFIELWAEYIAFNFTTGDRIF